MALSHTLPRRFLAAFSFFLFASALSAAPLKPEETGKHLGETAEVQGTVITVSSDNKGNSYLSFGEAYPKQSFTVQYARATILHPDEIPNTDGREIVVSGKIQADKYAPKIILDDARQIKVLPVDEAAIFSETPDSAQDRILYAIAWHQVLQRENFDQIETQAAEFAADEPRCRDGLWKSCTFFEGLSSPDNTHEEGWRDARLRFDRWREKFPKSSVVDLAEAAYWISYAWEARGGGLASTVTAAGWRSFGQRLQHARKLLENIPEAERRPYFYLQKQILSLGQSWDKEAALQVLEESKKHFPEFCDVYFSACCYLLPRWYGEKGEWEKFLVKEASDGSPFHRELYARVVWAQSGFYGNIFKETDITWPPVKAGFEEILRRYPGSWWNLNAYAKFASLADDKETCRSLMAQVTGHEEMDIWHSWSNLKSLHEWLGTKAIPEQ